MNMIGNDSFLKKIKLNNFQRKIVMPHEKILTPEGV